MSSARVQVSIAPPIAIRLSRVCSCAPPGHAGEAAHDVLRPPRRRLGGNVFEGDEARQQAAGIAALLHVGRDAADPGSARCRVMRRKVTGSNSTSASMIMTASAQFSSRMMPMP